MSSSRAGLEQTTHRSFKRPQGFEPGVRTLDDVPGKQHRVNVLRNREVNGRRQRCLGREVARIYTNAREVLGQTRRTRAQMHVANREKREITGGRC